MLTDVQRAELKRIQFELRQPFPPRLHEIRDLPGGKSKWVFLKWQTIRDRLDDIYPEWLIDHSEIQYLGNDAICRCGITIMGIRKEAIASVPISLISGNGREMTRGSAADRLAAESLKNASETWGVGRYLDDQPFVIKLLWDGMNELSEGMRGEVRKLAEDFKLAVRAGQQPMPNKNNARIAEIRTVLGLNKSVVIDWLRGAGSYSEPSQITSERCDALVKFLCLHWASHRYTNSYHANNSFDKRVSGAQANGLSELEAIKQWMQYAEELKNEE